MILCSLKLEFITETTWKIDFYEQLLLFISHMHAVESQEMKWMNLYQKGLLHKAAVVNCKNLRHILKT